MTRVLLFHQPVTGGVARHVRDLARGLGSRGYEVVVCGPERIAADVEHVALRVSRSVSPRDMVAVGSYSRVVRAVRPDLVHAHSSKAGAVARAGRILQPRIPVVYTPHGYAFAGYFQHEAERIAYREIERVLAPLAARVIAVCAAEGRLAKRIGSSRRVRVVHNGISPITSLPRTGGIESPVLCVVSQLRPGKGLETLIDAMPDVRSRHPNATVVVVGDGDLKSQLVARAHARGVADAVVFRGRLEDPLPALRAADVFVFPSLAESFPYAVLEAMAVGLPVVASDVGGIGEMVEQGATGLLVPPRDAAALGRAIVRLLDDEAFRARLGAAGAESVSQRFALDRMLDGTSAIYREVLQR